MKTLKHISKLFLLATIATTFIACNFKHDNPPEFLLPNVPQEKIITIKQLKESLWNPDLSGVGDTTNFLRTIWVTTAIPSGEFVTTWETIAHASEIKDDVYIKGRVISDDRQGNFFRQLFIQDETSGIVIKLGSGGLYNFYDVGQTVYIKCQGLVLGFYRGMYEIGYFPDEETYFPTSFIDPPTLIQKHILQGDPKDLRRVEPRVVTVAELTRHFTISGGNPQITLQNLRNDMMLGTLITIKDLQYHSTDPFLGNIYPRFLDISGTRNRRTGIEIRPGVVPGNVIKTWALTANDFQKIAGEEAVRNGTSDVVFIRNGPVTVTHSLDGLIFIPRNTVATVSHYYRDASSTNTVIVRTSGFSRFAGLPIQPTGDFTGVIGIYTSRTGGFPDYQLTIRDLNDVVPK